MFRRIVVCLLPLLAACRSQIQHGLDERDANEVITALVGRGFDAKKVPEKGKKPTWAIELDDEHATDALRVLTELKLPRPARTTTREVAASAGLVETPQAERLRQMEALEGDVEQMLETMDGVTTANVELVVPAAPRPGQPAAPSKASALLRVNPEALERLNQQRDGIRALIAGSVDGLKADDVTVLCDPVLTSVPVPTRATPVPTPWKGAIAGLAIGVLVLAMSLVFVVLRGRKSVPAVATAAPAAPGPTPVAQPPPAASKPVISAAVQRKVA